MSRAKRGRMIKFLAISPLETTESPRLEFFRSRKIGHRFARKSSGYVASRTRAG